MTVTVKWQVDVLKQEAVVVRLKVNVLEQQVAVTVLWQMEQK